MLVLPIRFGENRLNRNYGWNAYAPNFQANTSAGNPLRKLKGIKCPYFGVEMFTGRELNNVETKLEQCHTVKDVVKLLSKYKRFIHKTEKKVLKKFADISKTSPELTLPECLKLLYDEAITKLKLEEFNTLDDVDKISLKLSPQNALDVHAKTTRCRQIILENNQEDTFKRKTLLYSLDEIVPQKGEKYILEMLKSRAAYLPTSSTSENAFIVKYANRSHEEIARRMVHLSGATIEHIKPNSLGGANAIGNFLLTSAVANSLRSNMPLTQFIEMFPKIPTYCQKYIEQIIDCIHRGLLKGNETYPYKVQRVLEKESKGLIQLDLSSYVLTKDEAKQEVRNHYNRNRNKK